MPKGCFRKLKGSICNTAIDVNDIANILTQDTHSRRLVVAKLKRKLSFCGHVYLKVVWPD